MAEFTYNNAKNASTSHTSFELNCNYHLRISSENKVDPYLRSHSADEVAKELRELILICKQNLLHAQELQKQAHNKSVKPCSYVVSEKVWLNGKYIKI